jgi:ABC-type glycerol-3-phosphate transport system permease component
MNSDTTLRPPRIPAKGNQTGWLQRKSVRRAFGATITLSLLLLASIFFLGPFYWLFLTAVKPKDQLFTIPLVWWPREFVWYNFYEVWFLKADFNRYLLNTTLITLPNIIGQTLSAALVGYGFARGRFWGRNTLFVVMLATMMIPPQVTLIPLFVIFRQINWLDTFWPLIVPAFFGGGPYYIFLMRQFFLTIPAELEEAARIDGAGSLRIFWDIFLPLAVPALTAVVVFSFIFHWNDFFGPLIYLNSLKKWTLTLGLAALSDPNYVDYNQRMAGAFLISLPGVIVFFLAQRYFTEGIVMTGIKG